MSQVRHITDPKREIKVILIISSFSLVKNFEMI